MANERLPELLLVQTDLVEEGRPINAIYEIDRKEKTARMSSISTDEEYKILTNNYIFYPNLPHNDKEIVSDLYKDFISGGRE